MLGLHAAPDLALAPDFHTIFALWHWRPDVVAMLVALGSIYVAGWARLRGRHRAAVRPGALALYLTGLATIALALLSPIDALADRLLTAHMLQHELLAMGAAPVLLVADPLRAVVWGLPHALRRRIAGLLARPALLRRLFAVLTFMPVAWLLYMAVFWGWHVPVAYEAALRSDLLHDVQHLSFFGAALLFWWPLVNPGPRLHGHVPYGLRLAYVLATVALTTPPMMAIAFFMPRLLYPYYAAVPRLWDLSALDDQAMGWGLMGVLDGAVYAVTFLVLVARMAAHEERMTRLSEAASVEPTGTSASFRCDR
ncbi:MAG: cytochrome c oxidase assembly protein [Candidatus Rokuibacteriota bacterium]